MNLPFLIDSAAFWRGIAVIKSGKIKPLADYKNIGSNVATATGARLVMIAGAGIGVRRGNPIKVARKIKRVR
jgi:hypothetical protein